MRAAKYAKRIAHSAKRTEEIHISGAEGLYESGEIEKVLVGYLKRAMTHPRGVPDKVIVTVEKIDEQPHFVPLLPVSTVRSGSSGEAWEVIPELLLNIGITKKALRNAMRVVTRRNAMRGASLIRSRSGTRVEPDKERGVRVSRLGMDAGSEGRLSGRLSRRGINTSTVKEAMILASKVVSCEGTIAELCVSDDPNYTTGYVASGNLGYVRIPNIKEKGSLSGGRVFFVEEDADIEKIIGYLEKTPVMISDRRVTGKRSLRKTTKRKR